MPREFKRSDRVASQVQREMAELIRLHVKDRALGLITVSDAEVTRDLSVATLYVSFLGAKLGTSDCLKQLDTYRSLLRQSLGKQMRLRVLPEIRFVFDDSLERGQKMDALLKGLSDGQDPDEAS